MNFFKVLLLVFIICFSFSSVVSASQMTSVTIMTMPMGDCDGGSCELPDDGGDDDSGDDDGGGCDGGSCPIED